MMLVVSDMAARMLGGVVPGLQPAEEKATGLLRVLPEEVVVLVTEVSASRGGLGFNQVPAQAKFQRKT